VSASADNWIQKDIRDVLLPLADGKILHQGWSPRCETEPSRKITDWAALKTTAIQDGWFDDSFNKRLPDTLTPRPDLEVRPGDILITCAGPRVRCGIACLVTKTRPRLMISGKMYRFRANESEVTPEFLLAYLRSPEGQAAIDRIKTGGSESGLNLTHDRFFQLRVPVAPLDEQRRIAVKLASLSQFSKNAREELAGIRRLVERYKQAVLAAVMETDETGQAWPRVPLEELLTEGPTNGYSPRSGENPRGTLSLKLTATTRGVLDLSERAVKRLNEVVPKDSKFWLRSGDILIQRANSLEYVGMTAIYEGPPHQYIYPDLMIRIRVASPAMARWIWRYCSSASGRRYFTSNATGTAGNMPKINGSTVRKMQIPMPPNDRLDALIGRVDRALNAIDALQEEAARAQKLLDRLDQATLAKAFRGELVLPQPLVEARPSRMGRRR
jgi:type I restriction enzyme S subunit